MFGGSIDIRALTTQRPSERPTFETEKHVGINDAHELESIVARTLRPHRLEFGNRGRSLDAAVFTLKGRGISILILEYGEAVYIEPKGVGKFLLVDMPLAGSACYRIGPNEIIGDDQHAVVLPSDQPLRLHFNKELKQVIARIEWERIDTACERYFGVSGVENPYFEPSLDLSSPTGIRWKNAIRNLVEFSQFSDGFMCSEEYALQIEDLMIGTLLLGHQNNFSERLRRSLELRKSVVPRYVKRAIEYLHAHLGEQITISAVAKEVGVSPAALSMRFREAMQQTPGEYLRSIRLDKVRAELLRIDLIEISITDVACRFGFSHYGHFAKNYYERYGEHPRETVREARTSSREFTVR